MRRPLVVAVAVAALALFGAPVAYAQPSDAPTVEATAVEQQGAEPASEPADPPAEPDPAPADEQAPADPPTEDPAPGPADPTPAPPATSPAAPAPAVDPTPSADPTPAPPSSAPPGTELPTATSSPTANPSTDPSTAPPPVSITNIKVDVDIDDHSDHSIHIDDHSTRIDDHSTFIVEGDRYFSTYVYRDRDGKTYRGHHLSCLDFDTRADAQAVLDANPGTAEWLDADHDGTACERRFGQFTRDVATHYGVRRGGQVLVYPAGAVDTGRAV